MTREWKPMAETSAIEWLDEIEEIFESKQSIQFQAVTLDRCLGDQALFITREKYINALEDSYMEAITLLNNHDIAFAPFDFPFVRRLA